MPHPFNPKSLLHSGLPQGARVTLADGRKAVVECDPPGQFIRVCVTGEDGRAVDLMVDQDTVLVDDNE